MFVISIFFSFLIICETGQGAKSFKNKKNLHMPGILNENQIVTLARLSNLTHVEDVLDKICIKRVVGTDEHEEVKDYIFDSMRSLGWSVEIDEFYDNTPIGSLKFSNVIAKLNPQATRYLTLACHYDSKYMPGIEFVGAIDSAVPCAQLINTAEVMQEQLNTLKDTSSEQDVSLMFIFFDGEEAFNRWEPTDSIYGARHLAKKWKQSPCLEHIGNDISELDKIDLLVLLDLIGAPNPKFYNYSANKRRWYELLLYVENSLADLSLFENYSYGDQKYFEEYSTTSYIEDDHIPFLNRKVPILHLIPYQFPEVWHTANDNRENIDLETTENINKILRVFIASYLNMNV